MDKEQQIGEMAVIGCVRNPQAYTAEECAKCDFKNGQCNSYRHAEALYNAGYRKTFTSDFASDTQKAYKEGYEKGIEETKSEIEILKIQNKNLEIAFDRLEAENERLTERLKQVLLSIDTVKEMNAMCNIDEQRKQAVKEFAEWIKDHITDIPFCNQKAYDVFCDIVNEKLKEYEKCDK
jgi:flagellar biosynthesis/type III secretory pathway protein FliH